MDNLHKGEAAFQWNEWELIRLEGAGDDIEWRSEIIADSFLEFMKKVSRNEIQL